MQEYPWTPLHVDSPWSTKFNASGTYSRHLVKFSLSGLPRASDLSVKLDGVDLGWVPRDNIGVDRWHYDIYREGGLSDGVHEITFVLKNKEVEEVAQLCSVEILEFGNETQWVRMIYCPFSYTDHLTLGSTRLKGTTVFSQRRLFQII